MSPPSEMSLYYPLSDCYSEFSRQAVRYGPIQDITDEGNYYMQPQYGSFSSVPSPQQYMSHPAPLTSAKSHNTNSFVSCSYAYDKAHYSSFIESLWQPLETLEKI